MAYTTIDDPSEYFQTKIYAGSNDDLAGPGQSLTFDGNSDLQPDMMIWSDRDTAKQRPLMDSTMGTNSQLWTDADEGASNHAILTSFDSDGWTIPSSGTGSSNFNDLRYNYVGWAWKCNGGTTSTLTRSGSVTSGSSPTIQTNSTAKFSIVSWRSNGGSVGTFGHGLGVKPEFMIIKQRLGGSEWVVYHHRMETGNYGVTPGSSEDYYMELSTKIVATNDAGFWNDTAPTTSTVTIGADTQVSNDSRYFSAWIWAGVKGYSKFGAYEGDGLADGTFVYTGFKPSLVIMKNTDDNTGWYMIDNERDQSNPAIHQFEADVNAAEATGASMGIDLLSNGFKHRSTTTTTSNRDGHIYIYAAWAENPFVTSGGVPATAG